jgi:hypothetical protein
MQNFCVHIRQLCHQHSFASPLMLLSTSKPLQSGCKLQASAAHLWQHIPHVVVPQPHVQVGERAKPVKRLLTTCQAAVNLQAREVCSSGLVTCN